MPAARFRLYDPLIRLALAEDAARKDATSVSVLPKNSRIKACLIARQRGVLAGVEIARRAFQLQDAKLHARALKKDGARIKPGDRLLLVEGKAQAIFAAERTALNLLGHLSGIATLTRQFADRIKGTRAAVLDTRKTLPGLRYLEKYAVTAGGGKNHRFDLEGQILIKTNHLRVAYSVQRVADRGVIIKELIKLARHKAKGKFVEIEVANWREFKAALEARPDAILLDNWGIQDVRKAVVFLNAERYPLNAKPLLEYSGGVTLENVRAIAKTGVDRISIGRLTHSAPSLDVSLKIISYA